MSADSPREVRLSGESPCRFTSGAEGWMVCDVHGWSGPASQRSRVLVCPDLHLVRRTPMPNLDDLRTLSDAATPGPWAPLTHGTASQRDAAGRAFLSVMAVLAPDSPEIEYTDLSWVESADPAGPHIALVGNGPNGPENSKFIAAAVNYVRDLLSGASS